MQPEVAICVKSPRQINLRGLELDDSSELFRELGPAPIPRFSKTFFKEFFPRLAKTASSTPLSNPLIFF